MFKMDNEVIITTRFNKDKIITKVPTYFFNNFNPGMITEKILNLQEDHIRKALIKLGWIPPKNKNKENKMNEYLVMIDNKKFKISGTSWNLEIMGNDLKLLKIYGEDDNTAVASFVSKEQLFIVDTFYLKEYFSKEERKEDD
jgi:hypothetical protein